ncbi:MAG: RNA polymerase sigma factor [Gallionella sp.]
MRAFKKGAKLSNSAELNEFLSSVERRAYKQACYAVQDSHTALDIVQDAMSKLAEKYGDKPCAEFPMLFQRILQNTIRDYYRRQKVRNAWTTLFSGLQSKHLDEEFDPLETLVDEDNQSAPAKPDAEFSQQQILQKIELALQNLPLRQREAFLLRYWEGFDTADAAAVMGCSEGSVKTHCSRATHNLAEQLKKQGVELP